MVQAWFPFYLADYVADTGQLSLAEHGAYLMLMAHYYNTGKPIPANVVQLHRICKAITDYEQEAVAVVLTAYFKRDKDVYRHNRIDREIAKAFEISKVRRNAANKRHATRRADDLQNSTQSVQMHTQSQPQSHIERKDLNIVNQELRSKRLKEARVKGTHTDEQWCAMLKFFTLCPRCAGPFNSINPPSKDHITPIHLGGSDSIENIQPLCGSCNSSKGPECIDYRPSNWRDLISPKSTRFVRPTLEEVQRYCSERQNGIDAAKWFDYYSANGWHVGRHTMKDWKAAVRHWERNNYGEPFRDDYQKTGRDSGQQLGTQAQRAANNARAILDAFPEMARAGVPDRSGQAARHSRANPPLLEGEVKKIPGPGGM